MSFLSLFVFLNKDERLEYLSSILRNSPKEDENIESLKTGLVLDYYKENFYANNKRDNSRVSK